ncbi:hypothetical protein BDR06DRAFT_1015533 [Suillus hirtellus]|nr:hypothetical protein BDR06DRAFT_1015533 [Suillus hirtellus]
MTSPFFITRLGTSQSKALDTFLSLCTELVEIVQDLQDELHSNSIISIQSHKGTSVAPLKVLNDAQAPPVRPGDTGMPELRCIGVALEQPVQGDGWMSESCKSGGKGCGMRCRGLGLKVQPRETA